MTEIHIWVDVMAKERTFMSYRGKKLNGDRNWEPEDLSPPETEILWI